MLEDASGPYRPLRCDPVTVRYHAMELDQIS